MDIISLGSLGFLVFCFQWCLSEAIFSKHQWVSCKQKYSSVLNLMHRESALKKPWSYFPHCFALQVLYQWMTTPVLFLNNTHQIKKFCRQAYKVWFFNFPGMDFEKGNLEVNFPTEKWPTSKMPTQLVNQDAVLWKVFRPGWIYKVQPFIEKITPLKTTLLNTQTYFKETQHISSWFNQVKDMVGGNAKYFHAALNY